MSDKKSPDLDKLIKKLNAIHIFGFGMDALVSTLLVVDYSNRFKTYSLKKWLYSWLVYLKMRLQSPAATKKKANFIAGVPLLTFISNRNSIKQMNLKVLHRIKGKANIWDVSDANLDRKADYYIIKRSELKNRLAFKAGNFQAEYKKAIKVFVNFCRENKLSVLRVLEFKMHLLSQLSLLHFFEKSFAASKPQYVLTELDRYTAIAPLVIAARHHNIPCFTQVHGMLQLGFAYAPVLSNKIFCWGKIQADNLVEMGVPQSVIRITGAAQMDPNLKHTDIPDGIFEKTKEKKVLLLATNHFDKEQKLDLARKFAEIIRLLQNEWIGVIRIHPSEKISDYSIFQDDDKLIITDNDMLNYDQSLSLSDVIAVFNSAFIIDALVHKKPVVHLNFLKFSLGEYVNLLKDGLLPSFNTVQETAEHCKRLFKDTSYYEECFGKQSTLEKSYCEFYGDEAVDKMIKEIQLNLNTKL